VNAWLDLPATAELPRPVYQGRKHPLNNPFSPLAFLSDSGTHVTRFDLARHITGDRHPSTLDLEPRTDPPTDSPRAGRSNATGAAIGKHVT
jgi:hypothetical protein